MLNSLHVLNNINNFRFQGKRISLDSLPKPSHITHTTNSGEGKHLWPDRTYVRHVSSFCKKIKITNSGEAISRHTGYSGVEGKGCLAQVIAQCSVSLHPSFFCLLLLFISVIF